MSRLQDTGMVYNLPTKVAEALCSAMHAKWVSESYRKVPGYLPRIGHGFLWARE